MEYRIDKVGQEPHKHAEVIHAYADGHEIEFYNGTAGKWFKESNPRFYNSVQYRVYDPLREVKEAFEEGKTIQYRNTNRYDNPDWIDWESKYGGIPAWNFQPEWRIKPDNKLEEGKDYIDLSEEILVIDRFGNDGNSGFNLINGVFCNSGLICKSPRFWREATKEEVKNIFERHLIKRYGEDWRDVKVKECLHFKDEPKVNTGGLKAGIVKALKGWIVWNKNGCLFYEGKWAKVLKEEEIEIGNWKICDNFGERVFRHSGSSAGNNLEWRKATKQEVLNAPNYDGTATVDDFPLKMGDYIAYRDSKEVKIDVFNGTLYRTSIIDFRITPPETKVITQFIYYATKEEIESHKASQYIKQEKDN